MLKRVKIYKILAKVTKVVNKISFELCNFMWYYICNHKIHMFLNLLWTSRNKSEGKLNLNADFALKKLIFKTFLYKTDWLNNFLTNKSFVCAFIQFETFPNVYVAKILVLTIKMLVHLGIRYYNNMWLFSWWK